MARKKAKGTELSVFKGREAKLNRAIFQSLATKGPQTAYELHKNIRQLKKVKVIHYANVNRRIRALEKAGYVKVNMIQQTKAGFEAAVYGLTSRAFLVAFLDKIDLESVINQTDEEATTEWLALFIKIAGFIK